MSEAPRKTNVGDSGGSDDIYKTDVDTSPASFDFNASGETIIGSDMDDDDDNFFDE